MKFNASPHLATRFLPAFAAALLSGGALQAQEITNASFDISRELFASYNEKFIPYWKEKTGQSVTINQSHAGSTRQARAIIEGLEADVVTFNQVNDILLLVEHGYVDKDWAEQYPNHASPFVSGHAILVRKGNPKGVREWADLAKSGVEIVQVNPKTGGNGRYAALAYYVAGLKASNGDKAKARDLLKGVLANVTVFDQGGRAATTTFTEREVGDALVTFESEVRFLASEHPDKYEVVTPSVTVRSEFPVAAVSKVAKARGSTELVKGYLDYLYTPEGQTIAAENFYRPVDGKIAAQFAETLPPVELADVEKTIGPWKEVNETFFGADGLIDQLLAEIGRPL